MLSYENKTYTTIADVKARYPISEKKLKQLIRDGKLPEPEEIRHGTRSFRHYSDDWLEQLGRIVAPRGNGAVNG